MRRLVLIMAVLAVACTALAWGPRSRLRAAVPASAAVMIDDYILQWPMNDNAANQIISDTTGDYPGTIGNTTTEAASTNGLVNAAIYLNGINNPINASSNLGINHSTNAFSVAVWYKPPATLAQTATIAGWGSGTIPNYALWLFAVHTSGVVRFTGFATAIQKLESTATVTFAEWNHLAATRSGNTTTIYLNGASVAAGSIAIGSRSDASDVFKIFDIWSNAANGGGFLVGAVDDLRFYDYALSQAQIDAIYNSGNGTE